MTSLTENICVPIHLDAYALSPDCASGLSKLAPYTQPNYLGLRLDSHLIQHDLLDHVDFHLSSSASKNPRLSDVGSSDASIKLHRLGVHLHWTLPRFYRTATAAAQPSAQPLASGQESSPDQSQPTFPVIPNRWLVIRHKKSCEPAGALPLFQGWIIESDVVRNITDIADDSVDLQSDVAPFVSYSGDHDASDVLQKQVEVVLGQKFDLVGWSESQTRTHTRLTVMNSSNPLFPDYALHNTNALSMIDNFMYHKNANTIDYCTEAAADYYVVGWHSDGRDDPFSNIPTHTTLGDKLSSLMLQLSLEKDHTPDDNKLSGSVRSLNHGAIYNVVYNRSQKPTSTADEAAANFTARKDMEPLSAGTTTLDAIITFLKAHRTEAGQIFHFDGAEAVAKDLLQISALLYASGDHYDARVQAEDLIAQQNFSKADGGSYWTFNQQTQKGGAPVVPDDATQGQLRDLNSAQAKLDVCSRKLRSMKWDLFAEWWKFVSRSFTDQQAIKNAAPDLQKRVDQLVKTCNDLTALQTSLSDHITTMSNAMAVKKSARSSYYTRLDPTLCIAGVDSGRPKDFMDILHVQETHQLPTDTSAVDAIFKTSSGQAIDLPFPTQNKLSDTAKRVLAQCLAKGPGTPDLSVTTGYRDWGGRNPFIPLFLEWESVYYHVDTDKHDAWSVDVRSSPEAPRSQQVRYAPVHILRTDVSSQTDTRALSGRILVLPQPTFNLEATVKQVLAGTSPDMTLSRDQVTELVANIRNMQFISAPLSGLTNHLLTRSEGAHVKPNARIQGQTVVPLQAAVDAASLIHIDRAALAMVDSESALTPYGTSLDFTTDKYPFKPVTQGQMIFTKLNIIDKYGQAICVPTPRPRRRQPLGQPSAGIYPCLSNYLTPDVRDGHLNTVFELPGVQVGTGDPGEADGTGRWPLCEYMQLTPSINQDARLNASFVVRDTDAQALCPWRAATDYEQPVWGWIIVNYADYGLQFFLRDGTFYQEIRMGGANGTNTSTKYIPFQPPGMPNPTDPANAQLDGLIKLFHADPAYLQAFFDMINGAIKTMPFPPADYAGFANAIIGKPLALVNVGISLELAAPALVAQNTLGRARHRDPAYAANPDPGAAYADDLARYSFPVKLGDATRSFDGVVGYFDTDNTLAGGGATDWTSLHTYFLPDRPTAHVQSIAPPFPSLSPYFVHPETTPDMARAAAARWSIKSLLVDPYTPLHVYSPVLPSAALQLPAWTVQTALKRMEAFFRLGPVLVVDDVDVGGTPLRLPVPGSKGTWRWMQPVAAAGGGDATFVQLEVEEDHGRVKFAPGPYTFVEGFLALAGQDVAGLEKGGG
ncbi:hypothetical protein QBC45DRAFT_198973 [Copromyces sp. CBS 386.78]|nr:hypothetical protein QBC45DRAFT_198973 [Copromyces sp. CBS 386.78]